MISHLLRDFDDLPFSSKLFTTVISHFLRDLPREIEVQPPPCTTQYKGSLEVVGDIEEDGIKASFIGM